MMKYILLLISIVATSSCNTSIGLYRDTKAGFMWSKDKIQSMSGGGGGGGDTGGSGDVIY